MGVSASCDHCTPESKWSGAIVSFRLDGTGLELVARHVRAAYGLTYLSGTSTLFATMNQRDDLGARTPGDWLAVVRSGQDWGFPACYGQQAKACAATPKPTAVLDAHAAAGGVALVTGQLGSSYRLLGVRRGVAARRRQAGRAAGPVGAYAGTASTVLTGFEHPLPVLTAGSAVLVGDWGGSSTGSHRALDRTAAGRSAAPSNRSRTNVVERGSNHVRRFRLAKRRGTNRIQPRSNVFNRFGRSERPAARLSSRRRRRRGPVRRRRRRS